MKKLKPIVLSAWALLSTSATVFAQSAAPAATGTTFTWDKLNQFIQYINYSVTSLLSDFLLPIASVIVVGMIIWGGFKYIQGDAENGKKTITAAIIGLVIIALSSLIINSVNNIIRGDFIIKEIPKEAATSEKETSSDSSPTGSGLYGGEELPPIGGGMPTGEE